MDGSLNISDLEERIAERARDLDRDVTRDRVHIFEDPYWGDSGALTVQVAARRPKDRKEWTRSRLHFTQAVRDLLVEYGDDRHPRIEVFGPEEWAGRND